ncbi:ABC transporter ATP-binding protein [Spiractinospora alimapuensis]|uniref:ABC transporter ATP-binding protein n=1 Tax=Spiractinospora alimapuensis TaxID=2820884 RepID=UPI001F2857E3|nr:ABC transporter ATP-binding protein [Spiractinospora alimapuensis]QVQ52908.1 ABC transporter ATP-binding protein [Spiractinospora alimapuensis]
MSTTTATEASPHEKPPDPVDPPPSDRLAGGDALGSLLRPVRPHLIGCGLLAGVAAAAGFAPYVAVAQIAHLLVADAGPVATPAVWGWVAFGAAGAGLRLVLVFASSRLGHYADARLLHDLRERMVRRLGVVPLGWFREHGSGVVKRRMTNDLEDMHLLIAHSLGEVIGAAVAIVVGLTYLASVDLTMTAVTAGALAAIAVWFQISMRSMSHHLDGLVRAEERISAASVEYGDGVAVVKTFGTDGRVLRRFVDAVEEYRTAFARWTSEVRYSSAVTRLLGAEMSLLAILAVVGLTLVHNGSLSMAELLPFWVIGVGLPTSINPAVQGAQGLRKGRVAAQRVEDLLTLDPLATPSQPQHPRGSEVEFDHVTFSYDGRTPALDQVSAVCRPGTVTAVVGPSGAGKSTLASLVPRFYDVTGGAVRIGGVDVRDMDAATLLGSMALVFQDVMLLRDTVAANIRVTRPEASDADVVAAAKAAHVHEVIERLPDGYSTVLDGTGGLSGGERQRLTIARAILSDAPIVILDEATASLDADSEAAVQNALNRLIVGRTVLVVAHRLHTIAAVDQILVLESGGLVERGTHAELLRARGVYARMWAAQGVEEP